MTTKDSRQTASATTSNRPSPDGPLVHRSPGGHKRDDAHGMHTAEEGSGDQVRIDTHANRVARSLLSDPELSFAAEVLEDIEKVRIANENRLRQLTRPTDEEDKDGERRGLGLPTDHPSVVRMTKIVNELNDIEDGAIANLRQAMKSHPLGKWVKGTTGVGEKQCARLLAAIGDPYWNAAENRPRRGPAELWAYCGYVPGQKRQKGVKSNWSSQAKMRAFLIAESCIKVRTSPYRSVYDARRGHTATTNPEWTLGHSHNDALRVVAKEVLKDLWREAKRLHGGK